MIIELTDKKEKAMKRSVEKDEEHWLIHRLPSNATCDDLLCEMYVQKVIEEGLFDRKLGTIKGQL